MSYRPYYVPSALQRFFPQRTWRVKTTEKVLYLSFDDGPIPEVTPWVLDQLQAHQAKATFFCVGDNVRKHPEIFARLQAEGHAVGNHSFHHLKGTETPLEEYLADVALCAEQFSSSLFRPPYGRIKKAQAQELRRAGYHIIMWDSMALDWQEDLSGEQCAEYVLRSARPGSIVVFHDSLKAWPRLKEALPRVLDHFKDYRFEALSPEIL